MISRREFLGTSLGAGAALALTPELLRAVQQSGGKLIQRAIPSSGEMLPVISFSPREEADNAAMKAIFKTLLDNGGRVTDVMHGGAAGEQAARKAADELGIQNKMFWTTGLAVMTVPLMPGYDGPPVRPDPAAVNAALEAKFATFKVPKIDLVMVGAGGGTSAPVSILREVKKEGRVRYIGVHGLAPPLQSKSVAFYAQLESIMRNEQIDFIGTDYNVGDRRLEEKILPLALERKIGVLAYFSFDRGHLFQRASSTALPEWAAEFDAKTWAQFFLKYAISHPAITMARTGTTSATHMLDNIGGGIGRLPDEAMRKRMAELMDTFPPTPMATVPPQLLQPQVPAVVLSAAMLDRYVGEYKYVAAGNHTVTIRRDGERLLLKSGIAPEGPLVARSETRFAAHFPGMNIEFQLDSQGKVTGAIWEQGPYRMPLERR